MSGLTFSPEKLHDECKEVLLNAFFENGSFKFFKKDYGEYSLNSKKMEEFLGVSSPKKTTSVGDFQLYTFTSNDYFNGGVIVIDSLRGMVAVVSNVVFGKRSIDILVSSSFFNIEEEYFKLKLLFEELEEERSGKKDKSFFDEEKNILRLFIELHGTYVIQNTQRMKIILSFILQQQFIEYHENEFISNFMHTESYHQIRDYISNKRFICSTNSHFKELGSRLGKFKGMSADNLIPTGYFLSCIRFIIESIKEKNGASEDFYGISSNFLFLFLYKQIWPILLNDLKQTMTERINYPYFDENTKEYYKIFLKEFSN